MNDLLASELISFYDLLASELISFYAALYVESRILPSNISYISNTFANIV